MGFLDKLRGKKVQAMKETGMKNEPASSAKEAAPERRIKRYTSEGKPVYD